MKIKLKKILKEKFAFSLVEVLVVVTILAIVGTVSAVTFTNVLEDNRQSADLERMEQIDSAFSRILLYEDSFEEVKDLVYEENKLAFIFPIELEGARDAHLDIEKATLNDQLAFLNVAAPKTYAYLEEIIGTEIPLESSMFKDGYYAVIVEFNKAKVSDVRDFTINNDSLDIFNTGDEFITSR